MPCKTYDFLVKVQRLLTVLAMLLPVESFGAPPTIYPGERHYFTNADGGTKECRSANGTLPDTVSCSKPLFSATTCDPAGNFVRASVSDTVATSFAAVRIVTASVYNDFSIPGDFSHFVDAQIAVTYDFFVGLGAFSAYSSSGGLSIIVEDITDSIPIYVTNESIYKMARSGDQGFTDISGGEQIEYPRNEVYNLKVKLRSGRTYRIWFQAQAMAESDGLYTFAEGDAYWNRLMVDLGTDEVEQLSQHDTAIKDVIAQHDADIKKQLADLQGQITDINEKLDEIKNLLLTPQGLRNGFPIK
ncbi:MAG: hypothetical protein ACM3MB_10705 [Acidobacteriota bacterium]